MLRNQASDVWAKADMTDPASCWPWKASITAKGYGKFQIGGDTKLAHRVAYEQAIGPIPEGLQIDHLCRNRRCINPQHLEAVTGRVNVRRGNTGNRTECINGHGYTPENTRLDKKGHRYCLQCSRAKAQRHAAKCAHCAHKNEVPA